MAEVKAVSRVEAILNGDKVTPVSRTEAILNGDDVKPVSREEYFVQKRLAGGGGGLTYVIPEQTVTFPSSGAEVPLSDIGSLNELNNGDQIIIEMADERHPSLYVPATYYDGIIEGSIGGSGSTITIKKSGNDWTISYTIGMSVFPLTVTISAIKGF